MRLGAVGNGILSAQIVTSPAHEWTRLEDFKSVQLIFLFEPLRNIQNR